jgi:hypothetical protein
VRKLLQYAAIVAALIAMAGCAGTTVKKDAFAKPPKLAIITIAGSAHGLFTGKADDAKILADSVPACLDELEKSRDIRLLPANAALRKRAYAALKDEGEPFPIQLLPGYKRVTPDKEKSNLQLLAKELHVDGFLVLELDYDKVNGGGVGVGGLFGLPFLSVSSQKPAANATVAAFTPEGDIFWRGHVQSVGKDGTIGLNVLIPDSGATIADYSKLVSQLKGLTQTACQQAVKDLGEKVAAK